MRTVNALDLIRWLQDDGVSSLSQFTGAEGAGFNERADVIQANDGTDLNDFWSEVNETIAIRNRDRNSIIDQLGFRVTGPTEEVSAPAEVDFEEASEYGQPIGFGGGGARFFRGYDFKFYDLAIRYTWMFIAEVGRQQLEQNHNLALEADTKLIFRKVMQRLFNPINGNGFDDKNNPLTVFAAYNADGEVPPKYNQNTFAGTHNHYVISGNTAITPANLKTLQGLTEEHGYTLLNGYRNVLWVNQQEYDIIKGFRTATGADFDFVPNPDYYGGAVWVPNNGTYVGGPAGKIKDEVGTYGPFHVVLQGLVPAGYVVSIITGGKDNISNPIGIREHSNEAYRGLKVIPGQRSDYPLLDSFYRRGIGTGIRTRGALAIMQVKASGNYAIPAAYDPAA